MENQFIKTIKVSDKGQISIPNSLRQKLGINKGDNLILFEANGKLLIERVPEFSEKIKDDFKDILKLSEDSFRKIWNNPEDEIWNSYLK